MSFMLWSTKWSLPAFCDGGARCSWGAWSHRKLCTLVRGPPLSFPGTFCKTPEAVAPLLLQMFQHRWLQHCPNTTQIPHVFSHLAIFVAWVEQKSNFCISAFLVQYTQSILCIQRQSWTLGLVFNHCCTFICKSYVLKWILLTHSLRT